MNREHTEVLMELNINGIMDTAYSYGNQRLTNERFNDWTGYYTYDPRGSVSGVTDAEGMIWQSYRYDVFGDITFAKPQYNNVYGYNAESYNPNIDMQYLRARYYNPGTAAFVTEDSYLGDITDPLSLNRYNYVQSSPLNYIDPSGHTRVGRSHSFLYKKILNEILELLAKDEQGKFILKHYVEGTGSDILIDNDDTWSEYLKSDEFLMRKIGDYIMPIGYNLHNNSSIDIDIHPHMEVIGGEELSGLALLHGTNQNVGGFRIKGVISKDANGIINFKLNFTWNDIIDVNKSYLSDIIKNYGAMLLAEEFCETKPQKYNISISWDEEFTSVSYIDEYNWSPNWLVDEKEDEMYLEEVYSKVPGSRDNTTPLNDEVNKYLDEVKAFKETLPSLYGKNK